MVFSQSNWANGGATYWDLRTEEKKEILCDDIQVGSGGFLLGIQGIILSRSKRYGLMTSKIWVVLGRRRNNSGYSKEN